MITRGLDEDGAGAAVAGVVVAASVVLSTIATSAAPQTRRPLVMHGHLAPFRACPPCDTRGVDEQSITVFRSRLRTDVPDRYLDLAAEMHARAATFPGFVEFKQFTADDGERLSLVTFDSAEHEAAWRDDTEHRAAQQQGREAFYSEYDVAVCTVQRRHQWTQR
jgi:heme-degrading monooxygenase HmoA